MLKLVVFVSNLHQVANYEAVHEIRNWMDMKQRIGPYRRCYVFMHPSMPREPVCVLHTALRDDVPRTIKVSDLMS